MVKDFWDIQFKYDKSETNLVKYRTADCRATAISEVVYEEIQQEPKVQYSKVSDPGEFYPDPSSQKKTESGSDLPEKNGSADPTHVKTGSDIWEKTGYGSYLILI